MIRGSGAAGRMKAETMTIRRSRGLRTTVLVMGTVIGMTLAACGGSAGGDAGGPTGEVDRNATLRVGLDTPPPAMDPATSSSGLAQYPYGSLVYDRLTQMGPDLEVRPMLATSWEIAPDRRSVTFALRDGVTFSDGATLDAAAVKAGLDRSLTLPASTVKATLGGIASVDVVDPRTVRISAKNSAADLPAVLAGAEGGIVSPNALGNTDLDVKPVGSGPYTLADLKLGQTATFVRREGYWDPEAQKAARIEMQFIPDPNARLNALRSDQLDISNSSEAMFEQASRIDGMTVSTYPAAATINLRLNTARPNIDKPEVRQALNYAIDREALSTGLMAGQCDPLGQPLPAVYPGHLSTPPVTYTHDVAKARQLLAQAGLPNGFAMTLLVGASNSPFDRISTALQAQLAEAGITVQIVTQQAPTVFTSWAAGEFDAYTTVSPTTASSALTLTQTFQAPARYPGPRPADFDQAMTAATAATSDDAAVRAAVTQAADSAVRNAMNVWICGRHTQVVAADDVVGADTMGVSFYAGIMDLRYVGRTS
ncbi:ABC transporter substrate-binding protein [Pseudonocardia pini]|uniref:ABC transporter substrate-binding protein n=1 Tax=Pseudonocardia pini TaxID=2758030 RepID=UPI0015F0C974|nr:ABC transporter substrate-binding protein [Pseudonocardia pini]